ncbi:MAG TPA: hypothetical protein PKD64_18625 [Pirellulaceae bacterium]|nr:hypothetical protein [Pirellulaceae bacterium]HMO94206.1 hypothetical protein [Pirellulaceae bacterium]HMP71415.1 hypothetical protein [Pirellulaceae bacterium]
MNYSEKVLADFSPRTLNTIVEMVSGEARTHVVLSTRIAPRLSIVYSQYRVVAHPKSGLYDLFLAAALVRDRKRFLNAVATDLIISDAMNLIRTEFSRIEEKTSGFFHPESSIPGNPELTWENPSWTELEKLENTCGSDQTMELIGDEELELLLDSIQQKQITLKRYRELPLAVAEFQWRLLDGWDNISARDQMNAAIDERQEVLQDFIECYRTNCVSRSPRKATCLGFSGIQLDTSRLARLMNSSENSRRIFKKHDLHASRIFLPEQHVAFFGFDLNWLFCPTVFNRPHPALPAMILKIIERLGLNCVAFGFLDRLVVLKNGQTILLHIVARLKEIGEPFDDVVWQRLAQIYDLAEKNRDPFACWTKHYVTYPIGFPALHLQTLTRQHDALLNDGYTTRALFLISDYLAERGIPRKLTINADQADWLNRQVNILDSEYPENQLLEYIYVSPEFTSVAEPNSRVSQMKSFCG